MLAVAKGGGAMVGVRMSRWTLAYFGVSLGALLLAEGLWALGIADPWAGLTTGWVLVAVHLTTIGWTTMLMLGALQQFVPVLTAKELASQSLSGVSWALLTGGLLLMLGGFLDLPSGGISGGLWALPVGGGAVVAGVAVALINLGITLRRAWPWTLPLWFIVAGCFYLAVTVGLGFTFALGLADPGVLGVGMAQAVFGRGLPAHVVGGVVGWLTLTAMGVAYKLLAMFTLAPEHRGRWGWSVWCLTVVGVGAVWITQWFSSGYWNGAAWAVLWVGMTLYVVDMARLYHTRKRRLLELNACVARWALAVLAGLLLVAPAAALVRFRTFAPAVIFLGLYGWLGGLGLSQLYKILPFLTWLERYGKLVGRQHTPRVQELVDEHRDRPAYVVYFSATIAGAIGLYLGWAWLFRLGSALAGMAVLEISWALWRVRYPGPQAGERWSTLPGGRLGDERLG